MRAIELLTVVVLVSGALAVSPGQADGVLTRSWSLESVWESGLAPTEPFVSGCVAAPTFLPAGGYLENAVRVRLDCGTPDSTVYYTLDGSNPTTLSPRVSAGETVRIDRSCVLKAFAASPDGENSAVAWAYFTMREPGVLRVKAGPAGVQNSAWDLALPSIQAALDVAIPGDQIWVAAGKYPGRVKFYSGCRLLGGFAGNESTSEQRSPSRNQTVIDGGISVPYSVNAETLIDGFTICNGRSDYGGGVSAVSGGSVSVSNCLIKDNYATRLGGGVYGVYSLMGSTVEHNSADQQGGGVWGGYIAQGNVIADNSAGYIGGGVYGCSLVRGNVIRGNSAEHGGGVAASLEVGNCLIENNSAKYDGGGICDCRTVVCNTLVDNEAPGGGAVHISKDLDACNNIISLNSSGFKVYEGISGQAINIRKNCVFGNLGSIYASGRAQPAAVMIGNTSVDPMFANPLAGDYHLLPGSPCIDAGNETALSCPDVEGNPRPRDGDGDGIAKPDIGCYECPANYTSTSGAKGRSDGRTVGITNAVVTASFSGRFYVQLPDRISAIGVLGNGPAAGRRVSLEGHLSTVSGERLITATWMNDNGPGFSVSPFLLNPNAIGGGPMGLQNGVSDWRKVKKRGPDGKPYYVREIVSHGGANNIGLLIKTVGRVSYVEATAFYLDGGGAFDDGRENIRGIRVLRLVDNYIPQVGDRVIITGISSCYVSKLVSGNCVRLIRPTQITLLKR